MRRLDEADENQFYDRGLVEVNTVGGVEVGNLYECRICGAAIFDRLSDRNRDRHLRWHRAVATGYV